MAKLTSILNERFLKREKTKTSALAEKATEGALTSFSGIFGSSKLGEKEQQHLSELLKKYSPSETTDIGNDLQALIALTAEVRAINNQAAILHGERIKKAQEIFKKYCEGAFSAWLIATYGNRQTPYNFLQYYEFYLRMPRTLHPQIEAMPRQAIYTLASRQGEQGKKEEIVRNFKGETKQELLSLIRSSFPLNIEDKRREDVAENVISGLKRLTQLIEKSNLQFTSQQKKEISLLLRTIENNLAF